MDPCKQDDINNVREIKKITFQYRLYHFIHDCDPRPCQVKKTYLE